MKQRLTRPRRLLLAAVLVASATLAPAAHAGLLPALTGRVASTLPAAGGDAGRSCGWTLQVSGDQLNILFPDEAATYWVGRVPMLPGAHVELRGRFPHARYTSLTTYTSSLQAIDGLHDAQIRPDAGATNPFWPGADRTATSRGYTVRIVPERAPRSGRAPNTLYMANADGSKSALGMPSVTFVLRIYEGDTGRGRAGGVPLPSIALVLPGGQRVPYPHCPDTTLPDAGLTPALAAAGLGTSPSLAEVGLGGTNPPQWRRFTNMATSLLSLATGNEVIGGDLHRSLTELSDATVPSGGFAENPDNKYVSATFSTEFGDVLELRAKAPTFPRTREGQAVMGTGQVRYWSLCTNAQTTAFYGCKQDDQIPVRDDGTYRVVISTAAARPSNATEACGVAWLPAGPLPQSILILRNMLPDPSFAQAIQNAERGREREVMGDFYPQGRYFGRTADYERLGCGG